MNRSSKILNFYSFIWNQNPFRFILIWHFNNEFIFLLFLVRFTFTESSYYLETIYVLSIFNSPYNSEVVNLDEQSILSCILLIFIFYVFIFLYSHSFYLPLYTNNEDFLILTSFHFFFVIQITNAES